MRVLDRQTLGGLSQVRLVGKDFNEIINVADALEKAEDAGLDLVLVSDTVTPPVVRIKDQKKEEYEKKKNRKAPKKIEVKEVRFMANISDHDLDTKVKRIEQFLEKGNKVKITVRLKGRERDNPKRATDLINRIVEIVECKATITPGPFAGALLEPEKK